MAAEFYFTVQRDAGKYSATFEADDGEEYVVKYDDLLAYVSSSDSSSIFKQHSNQLRVFPCNSTGKSMTLEWKKKSEKLIMINIYDNNNNNNTPVQYKNIFASNELSATFYTTPSNKYVHIKIISHVVSQKYRPPVANEILTPSNEGNPVPKVNLSQLSFDMNNLLLTGNLSDVILTDGSKKIQTHKLVLSARSSVFAKMLQHPMKENLENRITIRDTSIEVLWELLHYMYSGIATIKDSKMARELYVTADKYDVKDLKIICSDILKSVNLNNVLDTLLLAELYSDKALKDAALNFISKHYSQLKAQQSWNGFMKEHQSLAIEILSTVIDKKH